MYLLKEFLETSTIHGLAYISTAPSKLSKAFWLLVVIFGFSTAFYLINNSYTEWEASPIATSISTHPISELDFPTITVCAPEGSNTALNYDLARARNITLNETDRERLINLTKEMLIDKPSSDFVKLARALANEKNILELFDRKPSLTYPIPSPENGFEIVSSQLDGSYKTPGFKQQNSCNDAFQQIHFVLLLPLVVMGNGEGAVLDINIEVDVNENWQVEYRKGAKYVLYGKKHGKKTWQKAEEFCTEKNGHLATIDTPTEKLILKADAGNIQAKSWIGGTDMAIEDVWLWKDATPWPEISCSEVYQNNLDSLHPCTNWAHSEPSGGQIKNCLALSQGSWNSANCFEPRDYICRFNPTQISTDTNLSNWMKVFPK